MPKLGGCCPFPVEQFATPTRGIDRSSESQLPPSSESRCHWDLVPPAKHGESFARDDSLVEGVLERTSLDDLGPAHLLVPHRTKQSWMEVLTFQTRCSNVFAFRVAAFVCLSLHAGVFFLLTKHVSLPLIAAQTRSADHPACIHMHRNKLAFRETRADPRYGIMFFKPWMCPVTCHWFRAASNSEVGGSLLILRVPSIPRILCMRRFSCIILFLQTVRVPAESCLAVAGRTAMRIESSSVPAFRVAAFVCLSLHVGVSLCC